MNQPDQQATQSSHPTNPSCIFCKIVAGQIPCHRLYEDERVLSFLDIGPLATGHCLVIPKAHFQTLDMMPKDLAGACGALLPRLGAAVMAATDAPGWNVLQNNGPVAGQEVPHVHFHVIPRRPHDKLGYRWLPGPFDTDRAKILIDQITAAL